jgi:uncharacterized OB-fold protein
LIARQGYKLAIRESVRVTRHAASSGIAAQGLLDHLTAASLPISSVPSGATAVFYPRVICPFTGSEQARMARQQGARHRLRDHRRASAERQAFNVALIDCDEGFRMMSRVEDIAPSKVRIGQRVRFRVHSPAAMTPYPVFVPRRARDERAQARQRGHRRRRRIGLSARWPTGLSVIDLMAQGTQRALDDCGLKPEGRRRLFSATTQSRLSVLGSPSIWARSAVHRLDHRRRLVVRVSRGPRHERDRAGLCNVAVIAYGSTQRSVGRKQASVREVNPTRRRSSRSCRRAPTRWRLAAHAQFGTTREQLAAVAVAAREWALLNPAAWEKKPLTIEGVLVARMVSYPFTVRDCCLVTDGGGAIIVTSAERAEVAEEEAGLCAGLRPVDHASQHLQHAGPDGDRRAGSGQGRLQDGQARPADVDARRAL